MISHESTWRDASQIGTIQGSELHSPAQAKKLIEARFKARGVDLTQLSLTRSEFGYLRLGRNSVQNYLAPYYAFFYEPASPEVVDKKRVEIIPAIKSGKRLALIEKDVALERARDAAKDFAIPDDSR